VSEVLESLKKLREPFPEHQISKLCKPYKRDSEKGRCTVCKGWHGLPAIALDYVGHAALTDRLLETDPLWSWEPMALAPDGTPLVDRDGGLWIKLTVCGVTRIGYGDAEGKTGPAAMKERIGDALRNAAMRFGAALDLWHKGDLHLEEDEPKPTGKAKDTPPPSYDWTDQDRAEAKQLCYDLGDALEAGGWSDDAAAEKVLEYINKIGEGTPDNFAGKIAGARLRLLEKKAEPVLDPKPDLKKAIERNWHQIRAKWELLEPEINEVHVKNRCKKRIKEWTGEIEPKTPAYYKAILEGQEKEINA